MRAELEAPSTAPMLTVSPGLGAVSGAILAGERRPQDGPHTPRTQKCCVHQQGSGHRAPALGLSSGHATIRTNKAVSWTEQLLQVICRHCVAVHWPCNAMRCPLDVSETETLATGQASYPVG